MPDIFGIDIAGTVFDALDSAGGAFDMVLIKRTEGARDPANPTRGKSITTANHACKGFLDMRERYNRVDGSRRTDAIMLIYGASLPDGIEPQPGDTINAPQESQQFEVLPDGIKRDPAGAVYECLVQASGALQVSDILISRMNGLASFSALSTLAQDMPDAILIGGSSLLASVQLDQSVNVGFGASGATEFSAVQGDAVSAVFQGAGASTITASGTIDQSANVILSSSGSVQFSSSIDQSATAEFSGSSTVAAASDGDIFSIADLSGFAQLFCAADVSQSLSVMMAATGSISSNAVSGESAQSALAASGSLFSAATVDQPIEAALSGISEISASAATAPDAIAANDWTVVTGPSSGEIDIAISKLPNANGSPVTALQYSTDARATYANLTGTGTGSRTVSTLSAGGGITDGQAFTNQIAVRAVNAAGAGADGDLKSVTAGAGGGAFTPADVYGTNAGEITHHYHPAGFQLTGSAIDAISNSGPIANTMTTNIGGISVATANGVDYADFDGSAGANMGLNSAVELIPSEFWMLANFTNRTVSRTITGSDVTGEQIQYRSNGICEILGAYGNRAGFLGLSNGTWHVFRVQARAVGADPYLDGVLRDADGIADASWQWDRVGAQNASGANPFLGGIHTLIRIEGTASAQLVTALETFLFEIRDTLNGL